MNIPHNIYIHVPFCMSKCNYCAFFSRACATPDWDAYTDGIIQEINCWGNFLRHTVVPTIFFGGGTPSLMPVGCFDKIMGAIYDKFIPAPDAEITLEANPDTIDAKKLRDFIKCGVNRLSVGVQSLDDARLEFLGRRHDARAATKLICAAQGMGLRVSGDFIYGLPQDNVDYVQKLCMDINRMGLKHCSMYELTIEPNTPFGKMNLDMPTNDAMADMYCAISDTLNIPRYEVSNYATPNNECRHNQNIWDGAPYIGIGEGAAGRIYYSGDWYEQRGNDEQFDIISYHDRTIEILITGMRQVRGVKLDGAVREILNTQFIAEHPDLLQLTDDGRLRATDKGILRLDDLMLDLIR